MVEYKSEAIPKDGTKRTRLCAALIFRAEILRVEIFFAGVVAGLGLALWVSEVSVRLA